MLEQFSIQNIETSGATIRLRKGGSGPPMLLLHGYPQTHVMWHKILPALAREYTVVAADLRGYGDSSKPPGGDRHAAYSFREMARDQVEVMAALGFEEFCLVGHDRGARVAHRMMLDYPEAVKKAVLMDIAPTLAMYEKTDMAFAAGYYHWFFLIQPFDLPERLIGADPEFFLRRKLKRGVKAEGAFAANAMEEYIRCFSNPKTIHATCEDYRAAAGIDLAHDRADLGRRIETPLHVLWGELGLVGKQFDALAEWRSVATDVTGRSLPCGHYLAEELPEETTGDILNFFRMRK
jgi:haloacetate dehalogenase